MTFETKKRKLNTCMIDSLIDIEYTIAIMIREGERERGGREMRCGHICAIEN